MSDYGQSAEARVLAHRTGETHTLNQPYAVNSGNFAGNNSDNRAIAHGLTRGGIAINPKGGIVVRSGANGVWFHLFSTGVTGEVGGTGVQQTVTSWDTTNFYVYNSGVSENTTGSTYYWVFWG